MDLNNVRPAAPPEPAPAPLRVMRLRPSAPGGVQSPEPEVFDGGEALPESQGVDVGHPISDAEREALEREGYELPEVDEPDEMDIDLSYLSQESRASAEFTREMTRDLAKREAVEAAQQRAYDAELAEMYHSRTCPLPDCGAVARVPKEGDHGDVLGIGMSMNAAVQLEELLLEHLQEHSLGEWMAALKQAQDAFVEYAEARYTAPPPRAGIVKATGDGPVTPGPAQRSAEKQAAVDALDRRLGGGQTPQAPQDVAAHDEQLRARRAARRAQPAPDPYKLTPRWSVDIGDGVVGIKR